MQSIVINGTTFLLDDTGKVLVAVAMPRRGRIDPQLAAKRAKLVHDRTFDEGIRKGKDADASSRSAAFTAREHIKGLHLAFRMSRRSLTHLQDLCADWLAPASF